MENSTKIIKNLESYLATEEAVPVIDNANIIDPKGIDAKVRIEAIRRCIRIVKEVVNVHS